jgi:hypothetical protein
MATATISIGRGGGDRRLSDNLWSAFTDNIRDLLNECGATVFVDAAESIGEWEGVAEESRTWVADTGETERFWIMGWLSGTAHTFEQDAIALTIGATTLVTSDLTQEFA